MEELEDVKKTLIEELKSFYKEQRAYFMLKATEWVIALMIAVSGFAGAYFGIDHIVTTLDSLAVDLAIIDARTSRVDSVIEDTAPETIPSIENKSKTEPAPAKKKDDKKKTVNTADKKPGVVGLPVLPPAISPAEVPGLAAGVQEVVDAMNRRRERMKISLLAYSLDLEGVAMSRAAELAEACQINHNGMDKRYGENLYLGPGRGEAAAEAWMEERKNYMAIDDTCKEGKVCGHWTQAMSRHSSQSGCAEAMCATGNSWVVVCTFDPPGNIVGKKPY